MYKEVLGFLFPISNSIQVTESTFWKCIAFNYNWIFALSLAFNLTNLKNRGYPDEELGGQEKSRTTQEQGNSKLDTAQYEALLKGGDQVTSVLEEMITLVRDEDLSGRVTEIAGTAFELCESADIDSPIASPWTGKRLLRRQS
ncbi:hypothetical protein ACE6H2_010678 [Prunus campanulata]